MELPVEIIAKIFTYLTSEDRQRLAFVGQNWLLASNHPFFRDDLTLHLTDALLSVQNPPLSVFQAGCRTFSIVRFEESLFGDENQAILTDLCESAREVSFRYHNRTLRGEDFVQALENLFNLQTLRLDGKDKQNLEIFHLDEGQKERLRGCLETVKEVKVRGCENVNNRELIGLLEMLPSVETVDLSHLTVFRSEEKFFYESLFGFLEARQTTVKKVLLFDDSKPEVSGVFANLLKLDQLQLQGLKVTCPPQWHKEERTAAQEYFKQNPQLEHLELRLADNLSVDELKGILGQVPRLKSLKLDGYSLIHLFGLGVLARFPLLEALHLEESPDDSFDTILPSSQDFLGPSNPHMRRLTILHSGTIKRLSPDGFQLFLTTYAHIRHLNLSHCSLTDAFLRQLCTTLTALESLNISHTDVTDLGVVGARRTRDSVTLAGGDSINRLHHLRVLRMDYLPKVSDLTLRFLVLPRLRTLHARFCKRFSDEGVAELVRNCAALETLDLSECRKLSDAAVRMAVEQLPRLRRLVLRDVSKVSEQVFDMMAGGRLQVVDLTDDERPTKVQRDLREVFEAVPSLRKIVSSDRRIVYRNEV